VLKHLQIKEPGEAPGIGPDAFFTKKLLLFHQLMPWRDVDSNLWRTKSYIGNNLQNTERFVAFS
jgi:hypothetical protein